MNIGFFTDSYFPTIDGVTYTIATWRDHLVERGHEVSVVYPANAYEPDDEEYPVRSLPNPVYPGYRIPLWRRPATLPAFDVVHCHGPATVGQLGRYTAWRRSLPTVYTHHTPLEEYVHQAVPLPWLSDRIGAAWVGLETRFLRSFDVVTASTDRIDRAIEPLPLPVGIDMDRFRPRSVTWPTDAPVIGYCGRLSPEKHVAHLLELARERPAYDVVIVGEGPKADKLSATAPSNVTMRPFLPREELPRAYSALDVFVTASTADTLGLSTLEANACGTPVVAPDVPPFDTTIGPEQGRRYPHGDLSAMIESVEACLRADWDTRKAVEPYAVSHTIDRLTDLYRHVCNGERVAPVDPPERPG